jgi:rhodanese-related sulfurtransferase
MKGDTCKISRWQVLKSQLNNLTPEEFHSLVLETDNAVVIDVRTNREYLQGRLFDAVNIDYLAYDFWDRIETLDTEKTYFVYCRSGRRSVRTCTLMHNGGFHKVFNLDGGLNLWEKAFGRTGS